MDVIAELTKLANAAEKLAQIEQATNEKLKKQIDALDKLPEPRILVTGLVKTYMDAVKHTEGLTTVRPATLRALQNAEKGPAEAGRIAAALTELNKHAADLSGQKDKKAHAFQAAIESIVKQIEGLA